MPDFVTSLTNALGGNLAEGVAKIIQLFKVDPTVALQNQTELQKIQLEMQEKLEDSITAEIQASAEVIKAEAQSQSWLPRNVRPLALLFWSAAITLNVVIAIFAHFYNPTWTPVPLDPWVYKLTAIGFTGYVTARTWEKLKNADN